jgi:hypothetical protein
MKRVTGIGGIFFKCKDIKKVKEWYRKHLGLNTDDYGTTFEWRQADDPSKKDIPSGVRLMKIRVEYIEIDQPSYQIIPRGMEPAGLLTYLTNTILRTCVLFPTESL